MFALALAGGEGWHPLDARLPVVIATEALVDALSLAVAGFPALALCGTTSLAWIPRACAFRRRLLAFDADTPGDRAADELVPVLRSFGARSERLRSEEFPFGEGAKDWNEWLQTHGRDALADLLAACILSERPC